MWKEDRPPTLLLHLSNCPYQSQQVKEQAATNRLQYKDTDKTPRLNRVAPPSGMGPVHPGMSFNPHPMIQQQPMFQPPPNTYSFPAGGSHPDPFGYGQFPQVYAGGPEPGPSQHYSPPGSIGPSDSISQAGTPNLPHQPLSRQPSFYSQASGSASDISSTTSSKRRRVHSQVAAPSYLPAWSDSQQTAFDRGIARVTAAAGFSLSWVENPEVVSFFQTFVPQANLPSRGVLTRRLVPQTLSVLQKDLRQSLQGVIGTGQADGWTALNSHHLIAFMFVARGKVYTVRVHDASRERKTAENLLKLMLEVIETLKKEWGVELIAFTTDASGESRKARCLLRELMPHLITPDCYAHQVNLIVGDYFKV